MQITLTPETEALLEQQLSRAHYESPDDLIATALRVLSDSTPDDLVLFNAMIQEGIDDLDQGRSYGEDEVRAHLKAVRERL